MYVHFDPVQPYTPQPHTPHPKHTHHTGTGARFFYMATVSVGGGKRYAHIPFTVLASGFMGGWGLCYLYLY